jgi:hypothetical protein
MPFYCYANDITNNEENLDFHVAVNHCYSHVIDEDEVIKMISQTPSSAILDDNIKSVSNLDLASQALRDFMVDRVTSFTLEFESNVTDYKSLINKLFSNATSEKYANSPSAGDYLLYHYAGYSSSGSRTTTNAGYSYKININVAYYTNYEQEQKVNTEIKNALSKLNLDGKTQYQKVKSIYDYICKVCNYDYSESAEGDYTKYTTYGAIIKGKAVCQGYASLFYRLSKEINFESRVITSTNHAWNIVKIDKYFYNVDATWDDNYYDKKLDYVYFLTCPTHFSNHPSQSQFKTTEFESTYPITNKCYNDSSCNNDKCINDKEHQWDSGKVTRVATCSTAGIKTYTCSVCNSTKTETISKVAHVYTTTTTKATPTKDGKIVKSCKNCNTATTTTIPKVSNITLSSTTYTYDGNVKTPTVTVKDSKGKVLTNKTDYTVSYASGRKNVGTYTVTITLKGNYSGTVKSTFKINPKNISISSATSTKSKSFTVKWNKNTTQTTGYQIQYSTNSSFSNAKTVNVNNSTTSKTFTKLTANKKYYVRMRTYKTVGSTNYYSKWSSSKTVTTKK